MVAIVCCDFGIHFGKKAVQQFVQRIVIGGTELADMDGTTLIIDAGIKYARIRYTRFAKGATRQFLQPVVQFRTCRARIDQGYLIERTGESCHSVTSCSGFLFHRFLG